MSYKFQIGSAALSGAVIQRLGTALNNQYVFQNDGGTTKALINAHGVVSGSVLHLQASASVQDRLTAGGLTDSSLTATRVVFAGANGALSDDSDMTFATDTLTVTKLGAFEAAGAINFASQAMTSVDINSGAIDGTTVGSTTQAAGAFTTLSGSGALTVASTSALEGLITTNGGLTSKGALSGSSTLSIAGAVQLDGADDGVAFVAADNMYFRDAGTGQMRRDSWSDVMEVAAGTVTATGLENTTGVLSLAIHSLGAEVIATGDFLAFSDVGDNGLHKESVDDLFTKGPALATEATFSVADDYVNFLDGGATGDAKKDKWSDIVTLIAGAGLTATNGVLSSDASPSPNALVHKETLAEGLNYVTGTKDATVYLPQGADFGDTIRLKSQALGNGKIITVSPKAGGGTTIDGESSIALRSQYGAITMIYAVTGSWLIV